MGGCFRFKKYLLTAGIVEFGSALVAGKQWTFRRKQVWDELEKRYNIALAVIPLECVYSYRLS